MFVAQSALEPTVGFEPTIWISVTFCAFGVFSPPCWISPMKTWVCMTKRLIAWKRTEGNQKEPYLAGIGRSRPWPVPPPSKKIRTPAVPTLPPQPRLPQPRIPPPPYPPPAVRQCPRARADFGAIRTIHRLQLAFQLAGRCLPIRWLVVVRDCGCSSNPDNP